MGKVILIFVETVLFIECALFSGCATIMQGGPDHIYVQSKPEGARISLDDQVVGQTPLLVNVPHTSKGQFKIEKEGYETASVKRNKVLSGWIFGNLIFGGLGVIVGGGIDLFSHNFKHYREDPINLEMEKKGEPAKHLP